MNTSQPIASLLLAVSILFAGMSVANSQTSEVKLRISNEDTAPGEHFPLTVRATGLANVDTLAFSLKWDPNNLQLDSVGNFIDPPGLTNANFDFSQVAIGRLGLEWVNADTIPIPGFWPIFDLFFTSVGTADTIVFINYANQPVERNIVLFNNDTLVLDTVPGEVSIFRPLIMCMDTVTVFQNDTVCLGVRVADFDQIISMQYTQTWSPDKLEFVRMQNFTLPFLDAGDFLVSQFNGNSRMTWYDDITMQSTVTTLPDSQVIYEMCFVATGDIGDTAQVNFSNEPLKIEIFDSIQCCELGLIGKGALVNIASALIIEDVEIDSVNCYNPTNGRVSIQVSGGQPPYTYQWSNGDTSSTADTLGLGSVTVTITDAANNTHRLVRTFQVEGDLTSPTAQTVTDSVYIDCSLLPVALEGVPAGQEQVMYFWTSSNGDVVDSTANQLIGHALLPGTYFFTVIDSTNGCAAQDSLTVYGEVVLPIAEAGDFERTITCAQPSILLESIGSSVGDSIQYSWEFNNFTISNDSAVTVSESGLYTLRVTNTENFCQNVDYVMVEIDTLAPNVETDTLHRIGCFGGDVLIEGHFINSYPNRFYWTTRDGMLTSDTVFNTQTFVNTEGTYIFTGINTLNGCLDSATTQVILDTLPPDAELPDTAFLNCLSQEASLQVLVASDAPFQYQWTQLFGNGTLVGPTDLPSATVKGTGYFQVSVQDTLSNCRVFLRVEVFENMESPDITLASDTFLGCATSAINLQALVANTGNPISFQWNATGGGNIVSGENTLTPTINAVGIYQLIAQDQVTQCSDTAQITVTLDDNAPMADAGPDAEISCSMPSVILGTTQTSVGSQFAYRWFPLSGGPLTSSDTLRLASTMSPGIYVLRVTNEINGCRSNDTISVTYADSYFEVDAGEDQILYCTQSPLTIGGAGTTIRDSLEYVWSTPISGSGNIVSGANSPFAIVDEPGTYTLVVTDLRDNCAQFDQITLLPDSSRPKAVVAEGGLVTCLITTDTLIGTGSSVGDTISYQWEYLNSGIGIVSGANSINVVVNAPGQYVLSVTNENNGCVSTDTALVEGNIDTPEIVIVASGSIGCKGDTVMLNASMSEILAGSEYYWESDPNLSDSSALVTRVTAAGRYVFHLTDGVSGCSNVDTALVTFDTLTPNLEVNAIPQINCLDTTGILDLSGTGSNTPQSAFTFTWQPITAEILDGANSLTPTVTAGMLAITLFNDANGCTRTDTFELVADTTAPMIEVPMDFDLGCSLAPFTLSSTISPTDAVIDWVSMGGTILSDSSLPSIQATGAGSYTVIAMNPDNGCVGSRTVIVSQQFALSPAETEADFTLCDNEELVINANQPPNAFGSWYAPGGAVFADSTSATTQVTSSISQAVHVFVWTLSTADCPEYDSDTLRVRIAESGFAMDDVFEMDEMPGELMSNVSDNDDVPQDGWFVSLLSEPLFGNIVLEEDGAFTYELQLQVPDAQSFRYLLCSELCPEVCDSATVIIKLPDFEFDIDKLKLPNAITPNDDALNETLYFDFLSFFGDQFLNNSIVIFNRYGDIIWQSSPYANDWAGTDMDGNALPQGTYYYVMRLNTTEGQVIKGDVTILR